MTDESGRGESMQDRPYDDDTAGTPDHNRRVDYVEPKFDAVFDGQPDPMATQPLEPIIEGAQADTEAHQIPITYVSEDSRIQHPEEAHAWALADEARGRAAEARQRNDDYEARGWSRSSFGDALAEQEEHEARHLEREAKRIHDEQNGQRSEATSDESVPAVGSSFMDRFTDHEPSMGHEPDGPTGERAEQASRETYHFDPEKFDRETVGRIKHEIELTPGATWAVKKVGELLEEQAKLRSWSEEFSGKVPKEWGEVDRGAPWHKILEDIRNQEFKLTDDMIRAAITHPVPWVAGELVEKRSLTAEQQRLVEAEPGLPSWISDRMNNGRSEIAAEPELTHDEWLRQQRELGSH